MDLPWQRTMSFGHKDQRTWNRIGSWWFYEFIMPIFRFIAYWNAFIVFDITWIITEAVLTIDNKKNYMDECWLCNRANYTGMTTCGLQQMIRYFIYGRWIAEKHATLEENIHDDLGKCYTENVIKNVKYQAGSQKQRMTKAFNCLETNVGSI